MFTTTLNLNEERKNRFESGRLSPIGRRGGGRGRWVPQVSGLQCMTAVTVAEEFSKVKLTGNVSERRNRYESVLHNLMGFTLVCANH